MSVKVMRPSPAAEIAAKVSALRDTFRSGRTRPLEWRMTQLRRLKAMLQENEGVFIEALRADLGKPTFEAWAGEVQFLVVEIDHVLKHLPAWARPERVATPIVQQPGTSRIYREPKGVALVLGAWNYPIQLTLGPLIGALAAGNAAVLKPSELSERSSATLAEWVPRYLDTDAVVVVEGGVEASTALLAQRFDHIFYTGGSRVARIVMEAAAKHLTPVTLELGGKSPCIVDAEVDMEIAARRIVWGKFFNAGQTCVAPDYILVNRRRHDELLDAMKATVRRFYGDDPKSSPDFARIVNDHHFKRLSRLLTDGTPVVGGESDPAARYIAPTILRDVDSGSGIMGEEIFGPLLPVLPVDDIDRAIEFVNDREKPLALYVFSSNDESRRRVIENTSFGGASMNDTLSHLTCPDLPFGGIGESGMGAYHGHWGFEAFSHRKSVLDKATWVDPPVRYPPYSATKLKWARRLM